MSLEQLREFDEEGAGEAIVSAAIRGNVNEAATLVEDEVVRSEGTITIGATEFPVSAVMAGRAATASRGWLDSSTGRTRLNA